MRDPLEDRTDALHLVKVRRVWRTGHKIEFRNAIVGHQEKTVAFDEAGNCGE